MANRYFPQLLTGAIAQYPIRKTTSSRTIRNVLPDGSLLLTPDFGASHLVWQLAYQALSTQEVAALTAHFSACQGRVHAFTFLDPTDNLLPNSSNLSVAPWISGTGIAVVPNAPDPLGGNTAFALTNNSQQAAALTQSLSIPADYQYCFSLYVLSAQLGFMTLTRSGATEQQAIQQSVGPTWARVQSSGILADASDIFTISITLAAGQQIFIWGPQLEPQSAPSRYRATLNRGGVYANAHWAIDALPVVADGPGLFSTIFTIEAAI